MFETDESFSRFCKDNDLPYKHFMKSYKNDGEKIMNNQHSLGRTKKEWQKYKGWKAIKI